MNKGNGKALKKQVGVAAPPPPTDSEHTPYNTKRSRYMAGMTSFHPTAYASILAGSDLEKDEAEELDDVYASVQAAKTENTPPKKKARTAGKLCHMYCQIGMFNHVVMWFRISPVPHGAYALCNGDGVLKDRSIRDWFAEGNTSLTFSCRGWALCQKQGSGDFRPGVGIATAGTS